MGATYRDAYSYDYLPLVKESASPFGGGVFRRARVSHTCPACNIPRLGRRRHALLSSEERFEPGRIKREPCVLRPLLRELRHLDSPALLGSWFVIQHGHQLRPVRSRVFSSVFPVLFLEDLEIVWEKPSLYPAYKSNQPVSKS